MAKNKQSRKRPQPKHKKNKKSQHDKRKRLQRPNPDRKKTSKAKVPLTGAMLTAVSVLQAVMDRRIAFRLSIIVAGMFLADDRRTASAWFATAGVQDDWDRFYDCLTSVGRTSGKMATAVLGLVVQKFAPGLKRILLAMDDSPTSRYGKHVEGAGIHHHPTRPTLRVGARRPTASGSMVITGSPWLGWRTIRYGASSHCRSGGHHEVVGFTSVQLMCRSWRKHMAGPNPWDQGRTKHQLGVELLIWFMQAIRALGIKAKVWLVADGAYGVRPFLMPVLKMGIVVVSRLRKDACLHDLPLQGSHGNRIYGKNKISLAKRAGHHQGWSTITYTCRGVEVTRQYKTFLATSRLISGRAPTRSVGRVS